MNARDKLAANIRRLREETGLSQEALAEKAKVHRTYLSGLENGERNPTVDVLDRVARALGVPVSALLTGADQR